MSVVALLKTLRRRGIYVERDGDGLRFQAPRGALTAELRQQLHDNKADMLAYLDFRAAGHEYDYVGAQVDVLTCQAVAAEKRGHADEAARLFADQKRLIEGPYAAAGARLRACVDAAPVDLRAELEQL